VEPRGDEDIGGGLEEGDPGEAIPASALGSRVRGTAGAAELEAYRDRVGRERDGPTYRCRCYMSRQTLNVGSESNA
jgi:hypothetical protein